MQTLAVQFLDQGLHRVIFNAVPIPMFVVDEDVCILDYNTGAARLLGQDKPNFVLHRGGEVLQCVHASDVREGCGRSPACLNCVLRKSVGAAFKGKPVVRQPARMQLLINGKRILLDLKVSCHPFSYEQHAFALLMLEGLDD